MKFIACFFVFIILTIGLLGVSVVSSYNNIIDYQTNVNKTQADTESQLERRANLIPNLVKALKSYTQHENEIFDKLTAARNQMQSAKTFQEKMLANEEITANLSKLSVLVESNPEIKSNTIYIQLMDELAGTENRINYANTQYNGAVAQYNKEIKSIPAVFIANFLGFKEVEYYKPNNASKEPVSIDL